MRVQEIRGFFGEYRYLSNFWYSSFETSRYRWPTVEHAYQAAKSLDPSVWEMMSQLDSPSDAKKAGRSIAIRTDWEEVKVRFMENLIAAKFDQNPQLKEKLLSTEGFTLIEENTWGDHYWGVCRGHGLNRLGLLLMKYRDTAIQEKTA